MATASPDFENLPLEGVPDDYSGPTFVKKDYVYTTLSVPGGTTGNNSVTHIFVTPTAAVSHYTSDSVQIPVGTSVRQKMDQESLPATGFTFPDAGSLFPAAEIKTPSANYFNNTTNVVQGRVIGHSAELVCVNNAFTQFGTIGSFKTPLIREVIPGRDNSNLRIAGVHALYADPLSSECNLAPVRDGCYMVGMSKESEFQFADVLEDVAGFSEFDGTNTAAESAAIPAVTKFTGPAVAWDNGFDTLVFRITVPPEVAAQSFILKVWRTWEYKPVANSLAHSISHASPPHSERTVELYHEIAKNLPVSVPAKMNPDFWQTVLTAVRNGSELLSHVPLPKIAAVAKGVHVVSALAEDIVKKRNAARAAGRARSAARATGANKLPPNRPRRRRKGRRRRAR